MDPKLAKSGFYHVDSPSVEAAPLPTREAILESMGRPEGLIPMVWEAAKQKKISFKDVREIEELEFGEFVLQCANRDYTFKAPSEAKCQALGQLIEHLVEESASLQRKWEAARRDGSGKIRNLTEFAN